ncbi:MAG: DMT family transporter [Raoultibacter sp.]|jgi:drug/metabolite transporter (DMT)-like permease
MNNNLKAYSAAFAFACTIGLSFMAIKVCLQYASSIDVLAHRFLIAGLIAIGVVLVKREGPKLSFKDMLPIFGLSFFYPFLFFLLQTLSLVYIETIQAGIIQALSPALILILALFVLKERITPAKCLFVAISVGGVIFIFLMSGALEVSYSPLGIALILGATFAMSCSTVLTRKLTQTYSVFTLTTVISLVGCVIFSGIALGVNISQDSLPHFFDAFAHIDYLVAILFLGVASSYCSAFLSNYALSKLQASKMSVFNNLATIISLVVGAVFLNESFYWYHALGALAVIIGVLGMNITKNSTRE